MKIGDKVKSWDGFTGTVVNLEHGLEPRVCVRYPDGWAGWSRTYNWEVI